MRIFVVYTNNIMTGGGLVVIVQAFLVGFFFLELVLFAVESGAFLLGAEAACPM